MGISFLRHDNITAGAFAHAKWLDREDLDIALTDAAAVGLVDVVWVTEEKKSEYLIVILILESLKAVNYVILV